MVLFDWQVDKELYRKLSESGWSHVVQKLVAPERSGVAWTMKAGQTCRIVVAYGKQVRKNWSYL